MRTLLLGLALAPALLQASPASPHRREFAEGAQHRREFVIDAKKFAFSPERIEVSEGDLVRITLIAGDIPHSFTVDAYKIAKRGEPGKPVTFEFLADHTGTFRFYCNLSIDDGCRKMAGNIVVTKKP